MSDTSHYLGGNRCPYCDRINDGTAETGPENLPPDPMDLSMCMYCGEIALFTDKLTLRKPDPGELERIFAADPEVAKTMALAKIAWSVAKSLWPEGKP